jgi:hypothetical protein
MANEIFLKSCHGLVTAAGRVQRDRIDVGVSGLTRIKLSNKRTSSRWLLMHIVYCSTTTWRLTFSDAFSSVGTTTALAGAAPRANGRTLCAVWDRPGRLLVPRHPGRPASRSLS